MDKKIALVLGGTSPHIELIKKIRSRGYYVILVDYLENAPARKYADEHILESTLDKEMILNIAIERKAELVISTCIDQANSTCCYVAEKLGLPKPYDYETSISVTNKNIMKSIMLESEIPTSEYKAFENVDEIKWEELKYPSVIKPVDCNSSKGVHRVDGAEEAKKYAVEALELSRTNKALVEDFNSGEEIQVDCYATEDDAIVIMTRQKQKIVGNNGMVLQSFGSIIPAPLNDVLIEKTKDIARKIAKGFSLKNTPFFYQAIVDGEDINVLEFAPRIGGGLSYYIIKEVTGYDPIEVAIDSFLGKSSQIKLKDKDIRYSTNFIYMNPGTFENITGLEEMKNNEIVAEYFVLKSKGTVVDKDMSSGNRVGAFVVKAETYDELFEKAAYVYKNIEVVDSQQRPLLKRDAYILKEGK